MLSLMIDVIEYLLMFVSLCLFIASTLVTDIAAAVVTFAAIAVTPGRVRSKPLTTSIFLPTKMLLGGHDQPADGLHY
jgi:hypothetical protein